MWRSKPIAFDKHVEEYIKILSKREQRGLISGEKQEKLVIKIFEWRAKALLIEQ